MGGRSDEFEERINFEVKGDLAKWLKELKERGFVGSNPEAVRFALVLLRDHYNKMGVM